MVLRVLDGSFGVFVDTETDEQTFFSICKYAYSRYMIETRQKCLNVYNKEKRIVFSLNAEFIIFACHGKYVVLSDIMRGKFPIYRIDFEEKKLIHVYTPKEYAIFYKGYNSTVIVEDRIVKIFADDGIYNINIPFACVFEGILEENHILFADANAMKILMNFKTKDVVHKTRNFIRYANDNYVVEEGPDGKLIVCINGEAIDVGAHFGMRFIHNDKIYCHKMGSTKSEIVDISGKISWMPPK